MRPSLPRYCLFESVYFTSRNLAHYYFVFWCIMVLVQVELIEISFFAEEAHLAAEMSFFEVFRYADLVRSEDTPITMITPIDRSKSIRHHLLHILFLYRLTHDLINIKPDFTVTKQILNIVHRRLCFLHLLTARMLPTLSFLMETLTSEHAQKVSLIFLAGPFFLMAFITAAAAGIPRAFLLTAEDG